MALIYQKEALQRFGPPPLTVRDAKGKVHRYVRACDPFTGEIMGAFQPWTWLHRVLYQCMAPAWAIAVGEPLRKRWQIYTYSTGTIGAHYFAPAPLTVCRSVAGDV